MLQRILCLAILFMINLVPLYAQTSRGTIAEPDPLFQSSDPLDITFTAPFGLIDDERDRDKQYEGSLRYIDASGAQVKLDLNLSVRGNWRLKKSNCSYAQLWVDLKHGQTEGTLFENQNRLKLVVQCKRQKRYINYLAKEQQLYQIFSTISDYSFDTRLVNATYVDSIKTGSNRTHLAFFIEHQNRMAIRFGMEEVELNKIPTSELQATQSNLTSLFMYMIGNTDFSLRQGPAGDECCHNTKLLVNDAGEYFAIPYDFDGSGFVDASYAARPNASIDIISNRERAYRGYCDSMDSINMAIEVVNQSRQRINSIIGESSLVTGRERKRSQRYVDDFFKILDNPGNLNRHIVEDCRG